MPLPGTPFRNAAPGSIDARTRTDLDRLKVYGHWKQQVQTARELASRRAAP
jgi:hypothetical protein